MLPDSGMALGDRHDIYRCNSSTAQLQELGLLRCLQLVDDCQQETTHVC